MSSFSATQLGWRAPSCTLSPRMHRSAVGCSWGSSVTLRAVPSLRISAVQALPAHRPAPEGHPRPGTGTHQAAAQSSPGRDAAGSSLPPQKGSAPSSKAPPLLSSTMLMASLPIALLGLLLATDHASASSLGVDGGASAVESTSAHVRPLFELADDTDFFSNVARYGRYFVTVMLGTGYVMLKPLRAAFDKPATAFAAIAGIILSVVLVKFTLEGMLGMSAGAVDPSGFQKFTY